MSRKRKSIGPALGAPRVAAARAASEAPGRNAVEVYLGEAALVSLLVSSAEVYKKECYGTLLGYRTDNRILVEHAIPYQSALRKHSEVVLGARSRRIIDEVLEGLPKYKVLGEYHSHPMFGDKRANVRLGALDTIDMNADDVQIIVAINDKSRHQGWRARSDSAIAGTYSNYHYSIGAYLYPGSVKRGNPILAPLYCPYAFGLLGSGGTVGRRG